MKRVLAALICAAILYFYNQEKESDTIEKISVKLQEITLDSFYTMIIDPKIPRLIGAPWLLMFYSTSNKCINNTGDAMPILIYSLKSTEKESNLM